MMYVFGQLPPGRDSLNAHDKWRFLFTWTRTQAAALQRAKQDAAAHGAAFASFATVPAPSDDMLMNLKLAAQQLGCVTLRMDDGARVIRVHWLPGAGTFRFVLNGVELPEFVVRNLVAQNYGVVGA